MCKKSNKYLSLDFAYWRVVEVISNLILVSGRLPIPPCWTRICDVNLLDSWRTQHASSECVSSSWSWWLCHQRKKWSMVASDIINIGRKQTHLNHAETDICLIFCCEGACSARETLLSSNSWSLEDTNWIHSWGIFT